MFLLKRKSLVDFQHFHPCMRASHSNNNCCVNSRFDAAREWLIDRCARGPAKPKQLFLGIVDVESYLLVGIASFRV
jgi:hypothetical protein